MWDFSFSRAIAMVLQTLPFIVLRLIVYTGIAVTYVFTVGIGGALGWGFGHIGANPDAPASAALWGSVIGFALVSAILYLAREYLLYLVKAAHIAVLVEIYDGRSVPTGQSQIGFGTTFVKTHFAEASVLFGVDQIIKAVLRSLFRTINFFSAFLPIPALQSLIRLAESFVRMSLTYVDEIILAHLIRTRTTNPWDTARDGLILFAQNYMHFLKNAAWLSVMMWALTFVIFTVLLAPATAFVALVHSTSGMWAFGFAVVFAVAIKKALMEPIAIAALMQVYFKEIDGQTPNAEWSERLSQVSSRFRDLTKKSAGWATPITPTAPA
jgi:hypothetical protein